MANHRAQSNNFKPKAPRRSVVDEVALDERLSVNTDMKTEEVGYIITLLLVSLYAQVIYLLLFFILSAIFRLLSLLLALVPSFRCE